MVSIHNANTGDPMSDNPIRLIRLFSLTRETCSTRSARSRQRPNASGNGVLKCARLCLLTLIGVGGGAKTAFCALPPTTYVAMNGQLSGVPSSSVNAPHTASSITGESVSAGEFSGLGVTLGTNNSITATVTGLSNGIASLGVVKVQSTVDIDINIPQFSGLATTEVRAAYSDVLRFDSGLPFDGTSVRIEASLRGSGNIATILLGKPGSGGPDITSVNIDGIKAQTDAYLYIQGTGVPTSPFGSYFVFSRQLRPDPTFFSTDSAGLSTIMLSWEQPWDFDFPVAYSMTLTTTTYVQHKAAEGRGRALVSADFSNSLEWGGITSVRNAATGAPVAGWRVSSESGYDYSKSYDEQLLAADFDGNEAVDGRDFLAWQRGFRRNGAIRADGDADRNRLINANDLAIWQSQFGMQQGAIAAPEPSSYAGIVIAAIAVRSKRKKRGRESFLDLDSAT
jgi:hypothetical protein